MQRWFLSYHSSDQAVAERLKAAIERKDSASQVFFAPTGIRAGGSWTVQLAQEIAQANAFILLIGERVGPWQVLEYDEALDKWAKAPSAFPLIVILLEGQTAPGLPFLRRLHWIVTPDPASDKDIARLFDAASGSGSSPSELWRHTFPYRGLEAMEEKDSDYFFGRERETIDVLSVLASAPDRLPVLIGNSGVGKSSLAQAGVLAALKRQTWPEEAHPPSKWPAVFQDSRQWCFLSLKPGTDPLKALVEAFLDTWQFAAADFEQIKQQNGLIGLFRDGKATLSDLIDATERRRKELHQSKPSGFLLYVDQGEELYVRAEESQRRRFSELLAQALPDPRLYMIMSLRSDFLGHLQNDEPLFEARQQIDVAPLRETALRQIVSRPAQLLSARFEDEGLVDIISRRTVEDSAKDVGALPLLSYTLDDMWTHMVRRGDGTLRLAAQSFELGGVLVDRANKFLEMHPGGEDALRRVLTLRLATVREDGEPTRRSAGRAEFSDAEWRLVCELADSPNRLLVTVTTDIGETYAQVAHEAIFRRWDKLREWIAAEREFLVWRSGVEAARRAWLAMPDGSKQHALLMGVALTQAQSWIAKRAEDVPFADRNFVAKSRKAARGRRLRIQALVGVLSLGVVSLSIIVQQNQYIGAQYSLVTDAVSKLEDIVPPLGAARATSYIEDPRITALRQEIAVIEDPRITALRQEIAESDERQYVIGKWKLPEVHRLSTGEGVTVAIIDSAVDIRHRDLAGSVIQDGDNCDRPHPHGTATAGAIVAHGKLLGIAPSVKIIAACAFPNEKVSAAQILLNIMKGIDYAVAQGARVINLGFAGPLDPAFEKALRTVHQKGIVLVAPAGNAGPQSPPLYPGADPNVIAVTAVDMNDHLFSRANQGRYIAVAAPGVDILVAGPYNTWQLTTGTTVASAFVSGVAALIVALHPSITPDEIRRILMSTAKPLGSGAQFGAGLVDPLAALRLAISDRK
jgi:hypothetical protein